MCLIWQKSFRVLQLVLLRMRKPASLTLQLNIGFYLYPLINGSYRHMYVIGFFLSLRAELFPIQRVVDCLSVHMVSKCWRRERKGHKNWRGLATRSVRQLWDSRADIPLVGLSTLRARRCGRRRLVAFQSRRRTYVRLLVSSAAHISSRNTTLGLLI